MEYEFHPYLFNPLYWHLKQALSDDSIRYIFLPGGSSAAKTYTIVQALMTEQLERNCNVMVYRKEGTTIDDTVYADYKSVASQLEIDEVQFQRRMVSEKTGRYHTTFKGLDDPEKAKGLSSYQYVYMNEISKFDYEDFDEIRRRLRGRPGQKIICDWNPISENHWMEQKVIDRVVDDKPTAVWIDLPLNIPEAPTKYSALNQEFAFKRINKEGNTLWIKTTHRDNYWVVGHPAGPEYGYRDEHTLATFEDYRLRKDSYNYNVYANGERGVMKTGVEFFDEWNSTIHTTDRILEDTSAAVVLTFDFNRLPYSTCLLRQIKRMQDGSYEFVVFDEVCLKPPANTIEDIRDEIIFRHPWIREVFFTGDPSGRAKGQRKSRDEADSYEETITRVFFKYIHNRSNIFITHAPPKAMRKNAMSEILRGKVCKFLVSKKCKNLINDFETLQVDTTGGYVKKSITDKVSKATYEEGGHCMDALIYDLAGLYPKLFYP